MSILNNRRPLGIVALVLALAAPALGNSIGAQADGIVNGGGGATAGGIVTACGASTGQLLYDNAGSCAGSQFSQVSAQVGALSDSTTASGFFAYNTVDSVLSPTNYERGVFDWTTNTNLLTIGTQAGGTGTARDLVFKSASNVVSFASGSQLGILNSGFSGNRDIAIGSNLGASTGGMGFQPGFLLFWLSAAGNINESNADVAIGRNSAGVLEVDNGVAGTFRDEKIRHIAGGTAPTANTCTGFALGTGGSDLGGKITLTSATTCSINFGTAFTNAPACTVSPGSAASTTLVTTTTAVLSVTFGTAQTAFSYTCIGL